MKRLMYILSVFLATTQRQRYDDSMTSSSRPPVSGAAVLLANSVTIFFLTMILSGVNVALPAIGRDFGADVVTLGWVSTAGLVTSASALIPFGRIADIVGIRRIYTY